MPSDSLWIESHVDLSERLETRRFAKAVDLPLPYAIGCLHMLWHHAARVAQDGDLSSYSDDDLAAEAHYLGDAGVFAAALKTYEFVDQDGTIHNWWAYFGRMMDRRQGAKERMAKLRTRRAQEARAGQPTLPGVALSDADEGSPELLKPFNHFSEGSEAALTISQNGHGNENGAAAEIGLRERYANSAHNRSRHNSVTVSVTTPLTGPDRTGPDLKEEEEERGREDEGLEGRSDGRNLEALLVTGFTDDERARIAQVDEVLGLRGLVGTAKWWRHIMDEYGVLDLQALAIEQDGWMRDNGLKKCSTMRYINWVKRALANYKRRPAAISGYAGPRHGPSPNGKAQGKPPAAGWHSELDRAEAEIPVRRLTANPKPVEKTAKEPVAPTLAPTAVQASEPDEPDPAF